MKLLVWLRYLCNRLYTNIKKCFQFNFDMNLHFFVKFLVKIVWTSFKKRKFQVYFHSVNWKDSWLRAIIPEKSEKIALGIPDYTEIQLNLNEGHIWYWNSYIFCTEFLEITNHSMRSFITLFINFVFYFSAVSTLFTLLATVWRRQAMLS